ncbi:hypothetical protein B6I21_07270 [candidate division KSB1 bacterium 4572_119]|nr:MAG: hypothetical protein B6I21_07270 [candidate division KSB1 bacterium 4572_119]
MTDLENDLKIFSDHAEMDNEQEYGILTDNPVFIKLDSTGQEELKITGLKMELFKGGDKIVVTDSVNIEQKEANAKCGIAEFYRNENEIILKNDPYVWQKHDRLSGGVIHLFITENNKLAKTIIKEKAMVISRVDTTGIDTRENKLTGEQITMFFQDNELSEVVVEMKATSYYYVVEEDEDKGMNRIIGDKIIVQINNRKIVNIRIESSPQLSEGIFYPTGFEPDEKRKN